MNSRKTDKLYSTLSISMGIWTSINLNYRL